MLIQAFVYQCLRGRKPSPARASQTTSFTGGGGEPIFRQLRCLGVKPELKTASSGSSPRPGLILGPNPTANFAGAERTPCRLPLPAAGTVARCPPEPGASILPHPGTAGAGPPAGTSPSFDATFRQRPPSPQQCWSAQPSLRPMPARALTGPLRQARNRWPQSRFRRRLPRAPASPSTGPRWPLSRPRPYPNPRRPGLPGLRRSWSPRQLFPPARRLLPGSPHHWRACP